MLKSGDVIVTDEKKLRELAMGPTLANVRMSHARKLIEEADEALDDLVVVTIERVGRAKAKKPAFLCAFDEPAEPAATPTNGGATA